MTNRVYEPHIMENPALPFIYHLDHVVSGQQFPPNWHANIEILYCISGSGVVKCETNEYPFEKGDLCIINSNALHALQTADEVVYYCLIADRGFCADNGIPTDEICFRTIVQDARANQFFTQVIDAYEDAGACRNAKIRYAVLGLLIYLREHGILNHPATIDNAGTISIDRVKRCMAYIDQHLSQALTLDEMAAHIGVSKYYLSREFKRVTGQTVFTYLNMVRCKEAKRLILDGMSVSAAAVSCGFENLSYFTRVYKRYIGQPPSKKTH